MAFGTGGMGRCKRESPGGAPRGRWSRLDGEIHGGNSNLLPTQKDLLPSKGKHILDERKPIHWLLFMVAHMGSQHGEMEAKGSHKLQPGLKSETLSQKANKRGPRDSSLCKGLATPPDPA